MASTLKCPNPSCPYLFDPSRVPAGVVLTCPRCAMRFTLGPAAPVAPPAPVASAPAYPEYPPAAPQPPAFEDHSPPPRLAAEPVGPGARGRAVRPPRPTSGVSALQIGVLVIMTVALLAGAAVTVYFKVVGWNRGPRGESGSRLKDVNLTFEPPEAPWVQDDDLRVKLGSPIVLVYKRTDPAAYMAFGAKDYETRSPRPRELREGLTRPLNELFDDIRTPEDITGATWLGQPTAVAFEFRARYKDDRSSVIGQCHAVSHKGIGYWSICWAGEESVRDQLATFDATRGRFKLLNERDDWQRREVPVVPYRGHGADYELIDGEGVWKEPDAKNRKPTDEDPRGDLMLVTREKRKGFDHVQEATLVVMVIDGAGGDPLKEGRAYVEARRKAELEPAGPKFVPVFKERTDEVEGETTPGEAVAPVVRLASTVPGAKDQARLEVISAIKLDNKVVVVHAWCAFADRAVFEAKMVQVAGSLQPAK